jgi:hypothetical protein
MKEYNNESIEAVITERELISLYIQNCISEYEEGKCDKDTFKTLEDYVVFKLENCDMMKWKI